MSSELEISMPEPGLYVNYQEECDDVKYEEKKDLVSIVNKSNISCIFTYQSRILTLRYLQDLQQLNTIGITQEDNICFKTFFNIRVCTCMKSYNSNVQCLHTSTSLDVVQKYIKQNMDVNSDNTYYYSSNSEYTSVYGMQVHTIYSWRYGLVPDLCKEHSLTDSTRKWMRSSVRCQYSRLKEENIPQFVELVGSIDTGVYWCPTVEELSDSIYKYNIYIVELNGSLIGMFMMNFYSLKGRNGKILKIAQVVYQYACKDDYISAVLDCIYDLCANRNETCIVGYLTGQVTNFVLQYKNADVSKTKYYLHTMNLNSGILTEKDIYLPLLS